MNNSSIHIYTQKKGDKWYCFGTLYGYDYSFSGNSVDTVQALMRNKLNKNKVVDAKWHEPEIIYSEKKDSNYKRMCKQWPKCACIIRGEAKDCQ